MFSREGKIMAAEGKCLRAARASDAVPQENIGGGALDTSPRPQRRHTPDSPSRQRHG